MVNSPREPIRVKKLSPRHKTDKKGCAVLALALGSGLATGAVYGLYEGLKAVIG